MNPQGTIVTTILESNTDKNWNVFNSISRPSDLAYRCLAWYGTIKSESENLRDNKIFEHDERKHNFKVENFGHKSSVFLNQKYSDLIHVDDIHTNLNHSFTYNSTRIVSTHDANIHAIKEILLFPFKFGTYNSSGTCFTNNFVREIKWHSVTIVWILSRNRDISLKSYTML